MHLEGVGGDAEGVLVQAELVRTRHNVDCLL